MCPYTTRCDWLLERWGLFNSLWRRVPENASCSSSALTALAAAAITTSPVTSTVATATVATPIATISSAVATLLTIATTTAAGYESVQLRDERVPGVDDGQHLELMDTPIWTHAHPKHRTKRRC